MASVHDATIKRISFDGEKKVLTLGGNTEDGKQMEIIFHDTIAVDLINILEGNIIFGIEQVDLIKFKQDEPSCYTHWKQHGWPLEKKKHVFVLTSSFGLEAYVLADRMETMFS